jgi:tight adherence protein B
MGFSGPLLALGLCLGLVALGYVGLVLVRGQQRDKKLRQRILTATTPHMRQRKQEATRSLVRAQSERKSSSPFERMARLFGFDPSRPEQYPLRWWAILLIVAVVARIISGFGVMIIGPMGWFDWPMLWIFGCRYVFNWSANRRREKLFVQFPDALAMIVRSIRSGVPLGEAIRIVSVQSPEPTASEFAFVAADLSIGAPMADAIGLLADRNAITEYRFFATALSLQSQTGGRLGETLESLAQVVRKRTAAKARGKALASEARTSAAILGGLPILAMGGLYVLNPTYMSVLFNDPVGHVFLGAAFGSLGGGIFVMRTIINRTLA